MAARYYQQNIAQYNPLTMEEMMFAPMQMRQRHDLMDQGLSQIDTSLGQYDVLSQDNPFVQKAIDPLQQELTSLAQELATKGYDHSRMSKLMKLKANRERLFSPNGDVGVAQSRKAQVAEKVKQIQEQYKGQDPQIANYWINKLMSGEAIGRDAQGNLINTSAPSTQNVKHYGPEEITNLLDKQLGNIKDTLLKDYGFSQAGSIGSIQDIYVQGQDMGRSFKDITEILMAQLSPEVLRSAAQEGMVYYNDPQKGIDNLKQQIEGAAFGAASVKRNTNYSVVTNEDKKFARDKAAEAPLWTMDFLEGIGVSSKNLPDMDTSLLEAKAEINEKPQDYILDGTTGRQVYVDSKGVPVPIQKAFVTRTGELRPDVKLVTYNPEFASQKKNELSQIHPSYAKKSEKEIISLIKNFITKISENKVKTVRPVGENLNGIQQRVIGSKDRTGLLSTRQIKLDEGSTTDFNKALSSLGYSSIDDFYDKGAPSYAGYVPEMGAFAVIVNDGKNKNKTRTMYVKADEALQNASVNTMMMSGIARTGAVFQETGVEGGLESNPDYVKYFVNDLSNGVQSSKIVFAPPGKTINELYSKAGQLNKGFYEVSFNDVQMAEQRNLESDSQLIKFFK